jgi:hypothetical protein
LGNAGQFLVVFPELALVVVSTAQNFDSGWSGRFYEMVSSYILPAVAPPIYEK